MSARKALVSDFFSHPAQNTLLWHPFPTPSLYKGRWIGHTEWKGQNQSSQLKLEHMEQLHLKLKMSVKNQVDTYFWKKKPQAKPII